MQTTDPSLSPVLTASTPPSGGVRYAPGDLVPCAQCGKPTDEPAFSHIYSDGAPVLLCSPACALAYIRRVKESPPPEEEPPALLQWVTLGQLTHSELKRSA